MLNPRRVLTSELIYDRIWGYDFGLAGNALRVYIGYLRRKLEADGERRLIQTVHGVGYVLRGAVSLRRRITAAAALAVAAVAVTLGATGYLSTRIHLIGELQQELRARAAPFLQPHGPDAAAQVGRTAGQRAARSASPAAPSATAARRSAGLLPVRIPQRDDRRAGTAARPELPVDARVLAIAKQAQGSFFSSATVKGIHVEVLTVGRPLRPQGGEVALPLTIGRLGAACCC